MKTKCEAKLLKGVECGYCSGLLDAVHRSEVEDLKARIALLEGALGFYADPRNWTSPSGKIMVTPIWRDQQSGHHPGTCGRTASEALSASRALSSANQVEEGE